VGDEVELVIDTLYSDPEDGTDYLVWKWAPVGAGLSQGPGQGSQGR
jgi:hypothetical protein